MPFHSPWKLLRLPWSLVVNNGCSSGRRCRTIDYSRLESPAAQQRSNHARSRSPVRCHCCERLQCLSHLPKQTLHRGRCIEQPLSNSALGWHVAKHQNVKNVSAFFI